jgi:hypothetical protein
MRGAAPLHTHDLVTNARLTKRERRKFHNLRLNLMWFEQSVTTYGFIKIAYSPLTGGRGEGQCPAPFAGPAYRTLQIAPAFPDKPLLTHS